MRPPVVLLLAALLAAPALAVPVLATHGDYVRNGAITATQTGYFATKADRYFVQLNAGEKLAVTLEPLRATRSAYVAGDHIVPYDLGLTLYMPSPGGSLLPSSLCARENDPYVGGDSVKRRTATAQHTGQAVIFVKTDLVVPAGHVDYRLTVTINDHLGAGRVQFHDTVSFYDVQSPHCRLLA